MKKSLFHMGFYRDTLRSIKSASLFVLIFSAVVSSFVGFITLSDYLAASETGAAIEIKIISLFDIVSLAGYISTAFVPILVLAAFSYLYKRNESDFFETIPVKREAMAVSGSLAVMTVFLMTILTSVLLYFIITIPAIGKAYVIDAATFFLELLAVVIAAIFSIGVSLAAISVTGTQVFGTIVAIALSIVPRIVMTAFLSALASWNPTLVAGHIIPIFNSSMNIHYSLLFGGFLAQETPWNYVYTAAIAILILVIGIILFKKRGSETISHKYGKHIWRHIMSILIAIVPMAYAATLLFDFERTGHVGIILALIAIIAFAVHDKATAGRGVKNRGGIIAFVYLLIISSVYCLGLNYADNAFASYLPASSEIEYVSVVSTQNTDIFDDLLGIGGYLDYREYVEMRAENIEITDSEAIEIISDALREKNEDDYDYDKRQITVKIKSSGKIHYRKVYLSSEDYAKIESILASNEEYNDIWQNVSEGARYPTAYYESIRINHDMLGGILETMEKEIAKYGVDRYRESTLYEISVCDIEYTIYHRGKEYIVSVPVFEYMTETTEKLETARKIIAEREIDELNSVLYQIENGEFPAYISVYCYLGDSYHYIDIYSTNDDVNIKEFVHDLSNIISTDALGDSGNWISISILSEELWGESYYYSFAVDHDITEEELKQFFEKYEVSFDE